VDFTGKVALITGAAGGIGGATAAHFARLNADLHLVDVDEAGLAKRAEALAATGRKVTTSTADVTQSADVRGYVDAALRAHGKIDAFFNNAGIEGPVATLAEYPEDGFAQVVAVNLFGVFLGLRHVLPVMLEQGSGAIVNTGSLASERGLPSSGAYIATKHAVLGLTRTAAAEVTGSGVRVNAVLPGMIDTRMLRHLAQELAGDEARGMEFLNALPPAARTGQPEEVGAVVVFLCSDYASYVAGVGLPADGGILATMGNAPA